MTSQDSLTIAAPRSTADSAWLFGGALLLVVVVATSLMWPGDAGYLLTVNTVRLSLAWYLTATMMMTRLAEEDWRAETVRGRAARWCWSWAVFVFLVHLAMAFHFFHHWSHRHAFDHTRDVSGVGEGIYVSYLFTWLWVGDAIWWWASPVGYANRNVLLSRALHLFILFIVFNGTVVFEKGPIQIAGVAGTLAIAIAWITGRKI